MGVTTNANQLKAMFRRMAQDMDGKGSEFVKKVAQTGLRKAVLESPKDMGTLQRGWQLKPLRKSNGEIIAGYGNNVIYMFAVNYGWFPYGDKSNTFHTGYYMIEKSKEAMNTYSKKELRRLMREVLNG